MSPSLGSSYEAYGLRINSTVPLPDTLHCCESGEPDGRPLVVRRGSLPSDGSALRDPIRVYEDADPGIAAYRTEDGIYWFHDGVGALSAVDGGRITVDPVATATPDAVQGFILGPGLCSVFLQRERIVLHASSVALDGRTVAFAGPSGRGKSTAAAACYARGHDVVADDLTVVDPSTDTPTVAAGYPRLSVTDDVADSLGIVDRWVGSGPDSVDVTDGFSGGDHRLEAVYLLETGDRFAATQLSGRTALLELLRVSYGLFGEADAAALGTHMEHCGSIARACEVRCLTVPRSLSRLDDLVDRVRADTFPGE